MKANTRARCWVGFAVAALLLTIVLEGLAFNGAVAESKENQDANSLLDFFRSSSEDFTAPNYDMAEFEYVSEDGLVTKWYISSLKKIDGLLRTENSRIPKESAFSKSKDESSFEGDYVYLYYNTAHGYLRPIASKELTVIIDDIEWRRANIITAVNIESLKELEEFEVYRVADNVYFLRTYIDLCREEGGIGLAIFEPLSLTEQELTVKIEILTNVENPFEEKYNGYLMHPLADKAFPETADYTEEQKIRTLERTKD